MSSIPYTPGLDGLRALAIVLVMLFHADMPGLPGGNVGVDLFLVLSGYLITRLLLAEIQLSGGVRLRVFYLRRLWRLMPPLLLMLALYCVFAPYAWPEYPFHVRDVVALLLYIGNIAAIAGSFPEKLMHGWSLGLEEQFYLIWPLFMIVLWRRCQGHLGVVLLILFMLMTAWRFLYVQLGDTSGVAYYRPDMHSTGLILGAALAVGGLSVGRWVAALALMALVFAVFLPRSSETHLIFFIPLAELAAVLLIASVMQGAAQALGHPLAVHLGKLSYGLYLFHYPIMKCLLEQDMPWYGVFLFGATLSYLLAWISYHSIERYARQRRHHYALQL
ncbi:acyltransferase family protein [Pseudomonas sp. XK-1]|uniref:acyltransferase family protein n=1 Tax=Pseudomonas sp. XK-1 TaxID=3136019 RepID=UPI00311952BE